MPNGKLLVTRLYITHILKRQIKVSLLTNVNVLNN